MPSLCPTSLLFNLDTLLTPVLIITLHTLLTPVLIITLFSSPMTPIPASLNGNEANAPHTAGALALTLERDAPDFLPVFLKLSQPFLFPIAASRRLSSDQVADFIKDASRLFLRIFVRAVEMFRTESPSSHTSSHFPLLHHHTSTEEAIAYG